MNDFSITTCKCGQNKPSPVQTEEKEEKKDNENENEVEESDDEEGYYQQVRIYRNSRVISADPPKRTDRHCLRKLAQDQNWKYQVVDTLLEVQGGRSNGWLCDIRYHQETFVGCGPKKVDARQNAFDQIMRRIWRHPKLAQDIQRVSFKITFSNLSFLLNFQIRYGAFLTPWANLVARRHEIFGFNPDHESKWKSIDRKDTRVRLKEVELPEKLHQRAKDSFYGMGVYQTRENGDQIRYASTVLDYWDPKEVEPPFPDGMNMKKLIELLVFARNFKR